MTEVIRMMPISIVKLVRSKECSYSTPVSWNTSTSTSRNATQISTWVRLPPCCTHRNSTENSSCRYTRVFSCTMEFVWADSEMEDYSP